MSKSKKYIGMMLLGLVSSTSYADVRNVDDQPASVFRGAGSGYNFVANWGSPYAVSGRKSVYTRASPGGWYATGTTFNVHGRICTEAGMWIKGQEGTLQAINAETWTYVAGSVNRNVTSWDTPGAYLSLKMPYYSATTRHIHVRYVNRDGRAALLDNFFLRCHLLH